MSYARWSNSCWYAFYNVNGKLSLWYDLERMIDWDYDKLVDLMEYEDEAMITELYIAYGCTREEGKEAVEYIKRFIDDYNRNQLSNREQEKSQ